MKKLLLILLSSLLAVSFLSACGGNSSPSETPAETVTAESIEETTTEVAPSLYDEAEQLFADTAGINLPEEDFVDEPIIFSPLSDDRGIHFRLDGPQAEKMYNDTIATFNEQLGEPSQVINEDSRHYYQWSTLKDDGGSINYSVIYEVHDGNAYMSITYEDSDSAPPDGIIW